MVSGVAIPHRNGGYLPGSDEPSPSDAHLDLIALAQLYQV